jgi:ribose transport system substrate-binding protein
MFKGSTRTRVLIGLAAVAMIVSACTTTGASPSAAAPSVAPPPSAAAPSGSASAAAKTYTIGYSNGGGVGNGFREEQLCTARAEALSSGQVSKITVTSRNTDAAGQAQDIRDLIAKDVDAIVFNPNDPAALNTALAEATAAGIKTVSVDQFVTDPEAYNLYNNQIKYAELGAKWLFEKMGGTGTVYYMRGFAGAGADTDRHTGFTNVLKDYPNIKVLPSVEGVATGWDPPTATKLANEFIASGQYDNIQGIWTSGIDSEVVDAIKAAGKKFVPIVGTDRGSFIKQLLDPTGYPDLKGAAVTNTAAVGGAGVNLALKLLNGETVTATAGAKPNTVLLDPIAVDNTTDAGKATLKTWLAVTLPDPSWPLGITIDGWTTFTPAQAVPPAGCKGPNE